MTTIPAGEAFAGLHSLPYRYTVISEAVNGAGDVEAQLGAEVAVHNIPIFQFLVFYAEDLEIHPGPQMNLSGRIHTNGDLYLNAGATLAIGDRPSPPSPPPGNPFVQVSAAGDIYRRRKDDSSCGGKVLIDKLEGGDTGGGDDDDSDSDDDTGLEALELPCSDSGPISQTILATFLVQDQATLFDKCGSCSHP